MKNSFKWIMVIAMVSTVSACGKLMEKKPEVDPTPTYSETEFLNDATALNAKEQNLEKEGLKFEIQNPLRREEELAAVEWDKKALQQLTTSNLTDAQILALFQDYLAVAEPYLKKYTTQFRLNSTDGRTEMRIMKSRPREELKGKVALVKKSISDFTKP